MGLSLVLAIVTLGIWGLVWLYKIDKVWNDLQKIEQHFDDKISQMWIKMGLTRYPITFEVDASKNRSYFLYLILSVVTCGIWALVWDYKIHTDPDNLYKEFHVVEDTVLQTVRQADVSDGSAHLLTYAGKDVVEEEKNTDSRPFSSEREPLDSLSPLSERPEAYVSPLQKPQSLHRLPLLIAGIVGMVLLGGFIAGHFTSSRQEPRRQVPSDTTTVAATPTVLSSSPDAQSSNFVVLPGKFVGSFVLGMTKEDLLKIAPKPKENVPDRLVYTNQKTGNILIAHFQNNRMVQMDFTSKDFYTAEGIHPG